MDARYQKVFENNRRWVAETIARDPDHFRKLADKQEPHFLFIGCSDSRVPANVITGTPAGEMFVHRNIANQVVPTDVNVLAVLEYAVEVLGIEHVVVCGHVGCGGVRAAMEQGAAPPLVEHWLGNVRSVIRLHQEELDAIADPERRYERLVELNVVEQVYNLSRTPVIQNAWRRRQRPQLHGWVYDIRDGVLRDLALRQDQPVPDAVPAA